MKYKIFTGVLRQCFKDCVKEGYKPLTFFEVNNAYVDGKIEDDFYDTATFYVEQANGRWKITEDSKIIQGIINDEYQNDKVRLCSVWRLGDDWSNAYGRNHLVSDNGRLVGVK